MLGMDSKAAADLGFELNATYHNDYWNQNHTITRAEFVNGWATVESTWADGHKTIHSTQRGKRDYRVA